MGYQTGIEGHFTVSKPLSAKQARLLQACHDQRHEDGSPTAYQAQLTKGAVYRYTPGHSCQVVTQWRSTMDHAAKPLAPLQYPGYFNQWVYNKKNLSLKWDGGEKFYNHVAWLFYMISIFFEPWGVTLSGVVEWTGGYSLDCGILTVFQNKVTTILFPSSYRLPLTSDPTDVPWPFTLESNMFASNICEQLLSMLLAAVLGDIDKVHDLAQGTLFQLLDWDNIEFVGFSAARVGLRTLVASVLQASAGDAELLPSMVEIVQLGIPPSLCELLDSARSGRQPIHFTAPWGISDQISTCHTHTSELGYMTATHGSFELSRALTEDETRQLNRILQAAYIDGEAPGYALAAAAPALVIMNQRHNIAAPPTPQQLLRHAAPPLAQHHYPGKSCPWRLRAGRLEFDDGSNGYQFVAWLSYLLANFFIPLGVQLSGVMEWNSEEAWDSGVLVVNDNEVTVAIFPSTNRFEFEYLRDTIDYVTEKHHIKKAIKDRLMQMLVGEKDPTEMRALARQLVHRDLGLPDALFCDFQNMLLAIIKSEAGPQDAMDAITGMTPALAKYLLDDAPIIKDNGSDAVGCVSGIDQMVETD